MLIMMMMMMMLLQLDATNDDDIVDEKNFRLFIDMTDSFPDVDDDVPSS
jgi:hypothetical protein